jgi:thymidylate synthase (FAD)
VKVYIVGKTDFHFSQDLPGKAAGSAFEERLRKHWWNWRGEPSIGQYLIEFAGRLCYESWHLPNPDTATNSGYIHNIISQGHESVLEHVSVTFYVEGVSRNLSHELIRHRHLSFSELSQRFVDMSNARFVNPPAHRSRYHEDFPSISEVGDYLAYYEAGVNATQGNGGTRKQAREAARYLLPSGTETKFVVTGNLRAWRDVLKKRDSKHADAEMQLFAKEVKRQLLIEYPDVFGDLDGFDYSN